MANELTIFIEADTSGLNQALNNAQDRVASFQSNLSRIADVGADFARLGAAITVGLTVPIVALGKSSLTAYAEIQSLKMGLEAVMGSASAASDEFERLREVAKLPGLSLKDAVKGSVSLQAAGFSAAYAERTLRAFGNALATVGKGAQELSFVNLALTQLQNKASGFGQDLRQLTEQLPQLRKALTSAFGTADSESIGKSGATGAQVVQKLVEEFEKLPKVTGGLKNAFENLQDSITITLSKIGKVIDDNLDISKIVDKITEYTGKAVTAFENLDPTIQKIIIAVVGLTAAAGPLLVAVGGFMALLPTLSAGIAGVGAAFAALATPIGLVTLAIIGVVTAVVDNWDKIKPYIEESISDFKRLYNESMAFRLSIIAVGGTFESLVRIAGIALRTIYENFKDFGKGALKVWTGLGDVIEGVLTMDTSKIKSGTKGLFATFFTTIGDSNVNNLKGINDITSAISNTAIKWGALRFDLSKPLDAVKNSDVDQTKDNSNAIIASLEKTKKETEKQLSEIFPVGSIAELRQRAGLLKKAIEVSVNDIVKIRGLDKFGKETNKNGLPYFTGEILSLEEAYKRLDQINAKIDLLEPPKVKEADTTALKSFRDTLVDFSNTVQSEGIKIGDEFYYFPEKIAFGIDKAKVEFERINKLTEELNEDLTNVFNSGLSDGIANAFAAVGTAMANGGNVFEAFGLSILSSLGNIITQMGKMLIETGVGIIALKVSLKSLNPAVVIAAGAALVALGAAASASVSGLSNSVGSTSSASGGQANTNYSANYTSQQTTGNVFEFRISGNDLVTVINRTIASGARLNTN